VHVGVQGRRSGKRRRHCGDLDMAQRGARARRQALQQLAALALCEVHVIAVVFWLEWAICLGMCT
jgi:hypothetical protein